MKKYIVFSFLLLAWTVFAIGCKTNPDTQTDSPEEISEKAPQNAVIYLVALENNGQKGESVGCNDSLVPINIPVAQANNPIIKLKLSLDALFRYKASDRLYNSLQNSILSLQSANIEGSKIIINLEGQISLNGVCDEPRFKEQISKTAIATNPELTEVEILINGKPIDAVISGK